MFWLIIIFLLLLIPVWTRRVILRRADMIIPGIVGIAVAFWIFQQANIPEQYRWLIIPLAIIMFDLFAGFGKDFFKNYKE